MYPLLYDQLNHSVRIHTTQFDTDESRGLRQFELGMNAYLASIFGQ